MKTLAPARLFRAFGFCISIVPVVTLAMDFMEDCCSIKTLQFLPTQIMHSTPIETSSDGDVAAGMYEVRRLDPAGQAMVHSATAARHPSGGLRAFWYGGTREGGKDVAIYTSRFDPGTGAWSESKVIMTREQLSKQLDRYIKKLGNPAAFLDASGRMWLFFVSVSLGGWAGSSINYMVSTDGGETFGPATRLVTSPFFNVSTLVRGKPIGTGNDGIVLPVYHEFMAKFPELLVLDSEQDIHRKIRLARGFSRIEVIQPVIVPHSASSAEVFMRFSGAGDMHVFRSGTTDGAITFEETKRTSLPNPNSAVTAGFDPWIGLYLIYNSTPTSRGVLSLAIHAPESEDWIKVHDLDSASPRISGSYSYPTTLRDSSGIFHVLYTEDRKHIKHVRFDRTWLLGRIGDAGPDS